MLKKGVGGEGIKEAFHSFIWAQRELEWGWGGQTRQERKGWEILPEAGRMGEAVSRVAVVLAMALVVALLRSSGSMSVFKVCSSSEGGVVSVPEEVLRVDTPGLWAPCRGLVLGSVCWLVGMSCEVRADALVAAHLRRQSTAALLCWHFGHRELSTLEDHWMANIQNTEVQNHSEQYLTSPRGGFPLEWAETKLKYQALRTLQEKALCTECKASDAWRFPEQKLTPSGSSPTRSPLPPTPWLWHPSLEECLGLLKCPGGMTRSQRWNLGARGSQAETTWKITKTACACMPVQSCLILCDPMDCSPPGSSVRGIFQARILE